MCLFQRRMTTKSCIIYFSFKGWIDSKIWKVWFSILKLKIRRPIKRWLKWKDSSVNDQSNCFRNFNIVIFCSGSPAELIRFHHQPLRICFSFVCLFNFVLFYWSLCNQKSIIVVCLYFITSLITHTCIHIYIRILLYTPTHFHFACSNLVTSSYHKSYYFEFLAIKN